MRLLLLALVLFSSVLVAVGSRGGAVRAVNIHDLLREHPGLKEELQKKINARKDTPATSIPATASAPATTTSTTTTPTSPTSSPSTSTTTTAAPEESPSRPGKRRGNGRRRRPGAGRRGRVRVQNARIPPQ